MGDGRWRYLLPKLPSSGEVRKETIGMPEGNISGPRGDEMLKRIKQKFYEHKFVWVASMAGVDVLKCKKCDLVTDNLTAQLCHHCDKFGL
jgi:hypothetical protein